MQKVTVRKVLVLHGGLVGLTADQARRRAHLLDPVEEQPEGLEEGFTAYGVRQDVQFKIGEELYVEQLDKIAVPLVSVADQGEGSAAGAASGDDDPDDDPGDGPDTDETPDAPDTPPENTAGPTKKKSKKASKKKASKKKASKKKASKKSAKAE